MGTGMLVKGRHSAYNARACQHIPAKQYGDAWPQATPVQRGLFAFVPGMNEKVTNPFTLRYNAP